MDYQPFLTLPNAVAYNNLANVMDTHGDYSGGLTWREQVLELAQTAHAFASCTATGTPQSILDVVFAMSQLGDTKRILGDLPGAQAVLQQAVALAEQPPVGPAHPILARALRVLGRVLHIRGRYDEADATLQRALTMQEQLLGPNHDAVSLTLTFMGESSIAQGNYRRAKKLLIRAVAIAELHVLPDKYPDNLMSALHVLLAVYISLEDYVRAQPLAERHLALHELFLGPDHPFAGATLNNMAVCLLGRGKLSEGLLMYKRALAIVERVHGPNHEEVAVALCNIGDLLLTQGDHRLAKGFFKRSLAIKERVFGSQHLNVAHNLEHLATCCHAAGDLAQAKTLLERSLTIYGSQLGRIHPQTAKVMEHLALLASQTGRPRQAAALTESAAIVAVAATHQPCGWCGRMAVHRAKFCGQCRLVWYCNEDCQRKAWREHKPHCHAKPQAPASVPEAESAAP